MTKRRKVAKKTAPSMVTETPVSAEPVNKVIPSLLTIPAKLCRLCESKEGPFLNIFDADKVASKKIDDLLPFVIAENDDLPHKICFRCSAKLEELHEFVQKCIKTQENLCTSLGKEVSSIIMKPKTHRLQWEENLNKSNTTNDDICDAVVKKAMEGIKDLSFKPPVVANATVEKVEIKTDQDIKEHLKIIQIDSDQSEPDDTKQSDTIDTKNKQKKEAEINPKRALRTNTNKHLLGGIEVPEKKMKIENPKDTNKIVSGAPPKVEKNVGEVNTKSGTHTENGQTNDKSVANGTGEKNESKAKKPFRIMEHVNMIRVTGVGNLYQCQLCNRNFLKKDVVLTHWCAKTGTARDDFTRKATTAPLPNNPPKVSTVKYINTSVNNDSRKQVVPDSVNQSQKKVETKPKPRIGPASKVKRINDDYTPQPTNAVESISKNPNPQGKIPSAPNLSNHYKLVTGPNISLNLVETATSKNNDKKIAIKPTIKTEPDLREQDPQPYPVRLIQTMPRRPDSPKYTPSPAPFEITAEKKQSYQVIQTSNPNKLLISAKVKPRLTEPIAKIQKKKPEATPKQAQPVTVVNASSPEDPNFFTLVNVDPLLQPRYVLPTNSALEARGPLLTPITTHRLTSTDCLYTCHICNKQFAREPKLLSHVQSHYSNSDEDTQTTSKTAVRKRGRKN